MLWFPTRNMLLVVVMVGLSGLGACSSSSSSTRAGACRIVVEPNNNSHQCRIPIKSYEKWNRMWTTNCNPAPIPYKPEQQKKWIRPRPYAYP